MRLWVAAMLLVLGSVANADVRPEAFQPPDREIMVPVTGGRVYVRVNGDLHNGRPA